MKQFNALLLLLAAVFFLILSFDTPIKAQSTINIDSLLLVHNQIPDDTVKVNVQDKIVAYYLKEDVSNALEYIEEMHALSDKINFKTGVAKSTFNKALYFETTKDLDAATRHMTDAIEIYEAAKDIPGQILARESLVKIVRYLENGPGRAISQMNDNIDFYRKIGDSSRLYNAYHRQAWQYVSKNDLKLAVQKGLIATRYYESINDTVSLSNCYFQMSAAECELKNNESAIEYAHKSLRVAASNNKPNFVGGVLNTLSIVYDNMRNWEMVDSTINEVYRICKENDYIFLQKLALVNHGRSYEARGNYRKMMTLASEYMELEEKSPNRNRRSLAPLGMGTALLKNNQPVNALPYLNKALDLALEEQVKSRIVLSYQNRAEANALLNNHAAAFEDHKMYKLWQDSIYNETKSQQIAEMHALFNLEKKEQEILHQDTEISLLNEREKVSTLQKWLLFSALILSGLALGFGYYGFRQRLKRSLLEKEKVTKELEYKKKELLTKVLQLSKKNEFLYTLEQEVLQLKTSIGSSVKKTTDRIDRMITNDTIDQEEWEQFSKEFSSVHEGFIQKITKQFGMFSQSEMRLISLLKMNLTSKEIANILRISDEGIKKARYRLRKKMGLTSGQDLQGIILAL